MRGIKIYYFEFYYRGDPDTLAGEIGVVARSVPEAREFARYVLSEQTRSGPRRRGQRYTLSTQAPAVRDVSGPTLAGISWED
jgi:hypothetical protein